MILTTHINDLLVFAEVVKRGGFTAAGAVLGRPKSNISRSVTRLETALGVQLLERTTRHHTLTDAGKIYYEHCLRIQEELASAAASVETATATPRGRLRVCTSVTVGQSLIAQHLPAFAARYPEVTIDLRLTNRRVDLIDEGFDVVIRVGQSSDSNLISKYLGTRERHLFAAPGYLIANERPIATPEDLKQHRTMHMSAISEQARWHLQNGVERQTLDLEPSFISDDFYVLSQMAVGGIGIAQLPDYIAAPDLAAGRLIRVLDNWISGKIDFHALVPSRRGITPKTRAFLDYFGDVWAKNAAA